MAAGALLGELYFSGSRLSTGEPNETGTLFCYLPETISPASLYTDAEATSIATQPITLDNGGRIPYDTYPNGLWVTQPVRLLVQDSSGATVSDATFYPATADNVSVGNDGFTSITMDQVLDAAFASTGGQDFKYKESGGATERLIQDKFREEGVWVTDFGAVGNGIAIDTTAIQTAMNRAKALSCNLIFPAGAYKIDQALTLTSGSGMRIIGGGRANTTLTQTNATATMFTLASCTDVSVEHMTIAHSSSSSAAAIAYTTAIRPYVFDVSMSGFAYGVTITGLGSSVDAAIDKCFLSASTTAVLLTAVTSGYITNTRLTGVGAITGIEVATTTGSIYIGNVIFAANIATGVKFDSGLTGIKFRIVDCASLGTVSPTPIDLSALSTDPDLIQTASNVNGGIYSGATGSTLTPKWSEGLNPLCSATSGGAGVQTIAAPTPTPASNSAQFYTIRLKSAAGGTITWTFNAVFKLLGGGTTISVSDGHTNTTLWLWDGTNYRQLTSSDTTT